MKKAYLGLVAIVTLLLVAGVALATEDVTLDVDGVGIKTLTNIVVDAQTGKVVSFEMPGSVFEDFNWSVGTGTYEGDQGTSIDWGPGDWSDNGGRTTFMVASNPLGYQFNP